METINITTNIFLIRGDGYITDIRTSKEDLLGGQMQWENVRLLDLLKMKKTISNLNQT